MKELAIRETEIPGLLEIDLPLFGDPRGWLKENWQREKMIALGLPDFQPVQNNISFNKDAGVIRGIHAEPWDKFISLGLGKVFAAIVELRPGNNFGKVITFELTPEKAIFVPRGMGNSYQTLVPNTVFTYLVNAHWQPGVRYHSVNVADEELAIDWPIPIGSAEISDKDRANPSLSDLRKNLGIN